MANNNTENIYKEIIIKLCDHVKEDFLNEGIPEYVLNDMKNVLAKLNRFGPGPNIITLILA